MRKNQEVAIVFSQAFKIGLLSKYRKIPSAGFIAREFNLRAKHTGTITNETARRWLKGMVLPDLEKLVILSEWLEIDLHTLLSLNKVNEHQESSVNKNESLQLLQRGEDILKTLQGTCSDLQDLLLKFKNKIDSQQ
jgi:transcriptional regulator with XRE-family HTH domain